jgi:hypothetical protein
MNAKEISKMEHPPLLVSNLPIFQPLISYAGQPGTFPIGSMITITGEPGTGKTKYALQLLDSLAAVNQLPTVYNGFEQIPAVVGSYVRDLGVKHISKFSLDRDKPELRPGEIHVIDSLDAFAASCFGSEYPDARLATWLQGCLEQNMVIINVHHKTGSSRKEMGSAKFNQLTSIVIELKKGLKGAVTATTARKNRYPGEQSSLRLKHTARGLVIAPTILEEIATWMQNFSRSSWKT